MWNSMVAECKSVKTETTELSFLGPDHTNAFSNENEFAAHFQISTVLVKDEKLRS